MSIVQVYDLIVRLVNSYTVNRARCRDPGMGPPGRQQPHAFVHLVPAPVTNIILSAPNLASRLSYI